jgi:tetratricopeptide (TPR) repeat protein
LCGLVSLSAGACARDRQPPAALPPCVLPDVATASPAVQTQLRSSYEKLKPSTAGPEPRAANTSRPAGLAAGDYATFAQTLVSAGYLDEALACFGHAAALDPSSPVWPYTMGQVDLRNGDLDAAARAFEHVVSMSPGDTRALLWLGDTYFELGRFEEAQGIFNRVLAREPESAAALYGAGRTAVARHAYDEAVSYLEHARRNDPRATAINYPLALAYRSLKRPDTAAALLAQKGSERPAMPDAGLSAPPLNSAVTYEQSGIDALRAQDWKRAQQAFRKGLDADPSDLSLRYWLGTALYVSGDQPGAEREWRTVLERDRGYARAHYSLGALLAARGQQAQARREYAAAVQSAPNMPEAHARLADTLVATGQPREAMKEYEEAVRIDPTQADAWVNGTRTLIALKDVERARTWLVNARSVLPDRRELADLQAQLDLDAARRR